MRSLFGVNGNALSSFIIDIELQSHMFLLMAAAIVSTPLLKTIFEKAGNFCRAHGALGTVWNILYYSLLPVALLLLSTAGLVGASYNPFIYFQF